MAIHKNLLIYGIFPLQLLSTQKDAGVLCIQDLGRYLFKKFTPDLNTKVEQTTLVLVSYKFVKCLFGWPIFSLSSLFPSQCFFLSFSVFLSLSISLAFSFDLTPYVKRDNKETRKVFSSLSLSLSGTMLTCYIPATPTCKINYIYIFLESLLSWEKTVEETATPCSWTHFSGFLVRFQGLSGTCGRRWRSTEVGQIKSKGGEKDWQIYQTLSDLSFDLWLTYKHFDDFSILITDIFVFKCVIVR